MAYQTRDRDPIFDTSTREMIERRGKELAGLGLLALATLVVLIIGSYSPDDPGWMSVTEGPATNLLGGVGAAIASPLAIIIGKGTWALVVILMAWGLRFLMHMQTEQLLSRLIFAPIVMAMASVYASTLVPGPAWTHTFGLGGLFGDTVLGAVLGVLPFDTGFGLKFLSAASGLGLLLLGAFVIGVTFSEVLRLGKFLAIGAVGSVVMVYAGVLKLVGLGARGAAQGAVAGASRGAQALRSRREQRREARAYAEAHYDDDPDTDFAPPPPLQSRRVLRAEPPMDRAHAAPAQPAEAPRQGLLSRMSGLKRRPPEPVPEPELVDPGVFQGEIPDGLGSSDRISAKIANALRSRSGQPAPAPQHAPETEPLSPMAAAIANAKARVRAREGAGPDTTLRAEPPVVRGKGPTPMILDTTPRATAPSARAEAPFIEAEDDLVDADAPHYTLPSPPPRQAEPELPARFTLPVPESKKVVQHPPVKPVRPSTKAQAEAQPSLRFEDNAEDYELPPLSLLTNPVHIERHHLSDEALEENARMLESVLDDYGVKGEIVSVRPGPVVTMYELEPAPGLKASRVIGLADDIARSMSALSARVSTVPGRSVIGIELPNAHREKVVLREILSSRDFGDSNMKLPLALGKDIGGDPIVANLSKMPHLLIAGTTGSGKSVAINTMILSLLYRLTPEECRLIMIDPKMLELSVYDGIPHLLSPVVTDPKKAVVALKWVVGEMEERYRKMSKMGVRNIEGYNGRVKDALDKGEMFSRTVQTGFDEETGDPIFETEEIQPVKLPYIVVIVDEMADLMMVAGKEIEACIQRLAQMARASGIHLIMATQRPSVDVITGTIKANFPTRISFQVTSKIDSRTILGEQGAEQLLGMGDMLYMAGGARITRVHGPFVSDEEVEEIVTHLKSYGPPDYIGGVVEGPDDDKADNIDAVLGLNTGGNTTGEDALYDQAVAIVIKDRKCSTSYIQRKLGIGYNKAARLVEQMEDESLVSSANHVGKREILVPEQ